MLIFYDTTGKIVDQNTDKTTITGNISCMEITVPVDKELVKISTDVLPHVPVMRDKPKTATELTAEQIQMAIPQLLGMDLRQMTSIENLITEVNSLKYDVSQLKVKGGA